LVEITASYPVDLIDRDLQTIDQIAFEVMKKGNNSSPRRKKVIKPVEPAIKGITKEMKIK
jgi:hypothetical protein